MPPAESGSALQMWPSLTLRGTYFPLLAKKGKLITDVAASLEYLQHLIEPIDQEFYGMFEAEARQRLRGRDEDDWPVLAAALELACAVWTEDSDLFWNRYRCLDNEPY
jgi:predicted nucleic acid-binding protein